MSTTCINVGTSVLIKLFAWYLIGLGLTPAYDSSQTHENETSCEKVPTAPDLIDNVEAKEVAWLIPQYPDDMDFHKHSQEK